MNKIFVFLGIVAACNAASLHVVPAGETVFHQPLLPSVSVVRSALPAVVPSVVQSVAPEVVSSVIPSVVRSIAPDVVSSVVPVSVTDVELADWEAYKEKFGKSYLSPHEDRFRRNLYFASKTRVATHNELFNNGLAAEPLQLDIFADYTRDEIFSLRSILDEDQQEWNDYKLQHGKVYDTFEDRFRKTVYFIRKSTIEDRNLLFAHGLSSYGLSIDSYTDYFEDEFPSGHYVAAAPAEQVVEVPAVHGRALVSSAYAPVHYSYAHPYAAVRSFYPGAYQRAYYY